MSNILVYDVAAESGGALSILIDFYRKAESDVENQYYFVVSIPELENTENISVIRCPWVKKSWFHRLYMDNWVSKHIIYKYHINKIISLQNHTLTNCQAMQCVYVHNALPYSDYRFRLIDQPYLWFYQNVIGRYTAHSLKRADEIIVQTKWMKRKIMLETGKDKNIRVEPVESTLFSDQVLLHTWSNVFFYPATAFAFKNHQVIIDASKLLSKEKIKDYEIVFTISGDENEYSRRIKKQIADNSLPIKLVGHLNKNNMASYYQRSCLVFSSFIETVGLPLLEAKKFNAPIIAADCDYAHEAINEYSFAMYFDFDDAERLSQLMKSMLNQIGGNCYES